MSSGQDKEEGNNWKEGREKRCCLVTYCKEQKKEATDVETMTLKKKLPQASDKKDNRMAVNDNKCCLCKF